MDPLIGSVTRRERLALIVASVLVVLTRFLAVARSLWDWDEALFALAVRDYDVTAYHPQPPGFPLFIGAAKLLMAITGDEFRALQMLSVAASLFLFPAMFFLARELRASTFVSFAAATLLAFAPNVWFYGGTALSDVPSMVLSLVACTLLLRASRLGGVALGIAAAVRPQNLLIAAAPLVYLLWRRRRAFVIAVSIAFAIVAISYGIAARESGGWSAYRATLASHEQYIRATDSFLAPSRPSLPRVADDFFFRPYRMPLLNIALALLAALAVLARRRSALAALALFGPFCLFAWLYLDFHSASRFSIAWAPLVALLAAEGIALLRRVSALVLAALTTVMIA
ncbi:MAG TPA: glycosyltransferase 87 family protein, partial [Thermoanaerobaculia bacterium]